MANIISSFVGHSLLEAYQRSIDHQQPFYFLDSLRKIDFRNSIVSSIKSSGVFFRSFDPVEVPRFSTARIISEATVSSGAIIPLLADNIEDSDKHNLRCAYLAGIFHGLRRDTLLLQLGDSPVPLDYREDVVSVQRYEDVQNRVTPFAKQTLISLQSINRKTQRRGDKSVLQKIKLGASAAENEFRSLDNYFLETAEYNRALRGDGKLIVGRKGSGKTAIFFMVRDKLRISRGHIVVDLKPESHELIKLRGILGTYADAGIVNHTFTGFWQVIIMQEILLKLKGDYEYKIRREANALSIFNEIESVLKDIDTPEVGDFTERLHRFVGKIILEIQAFAKSNGGKIPAAAFTNFVYGENHRALREVIQKFAPRNGVIAVLFDNLDKGWPATGVEKKDVEFVRCLIDALNKLQREFSQSELDFRFLVFLRNDVYELLVETTADRGKESEIRIDWSDPEKLRLMIGRRLNSSLDTSYSASEIWEKIFPSAVVGEDSFQFSIRHSLMRPRFLLDILERAFSFAINRGHAKVMEEDLTDAVLQHSRYLVNDFGYEIRDVSQMKIEIIDAFLGAKPTLRHKEVIERIQTVIGEENVQRALELLIWYGFLGFRRQMEDKYIYHYDYIMRRMLAEIKAQGDSVEYVINDAFHVGLQ